MATIRAHLQGIITKVRLLHPQSCNMAQIRNSSFNSSKFLVDVDVTTKYETTKSPEDWKYVERILPVATVPEPKKLPVYASGWKPQADDLTDRPYFVARTRNHMMPVYLDIRQRGTARHTIIKKIQGDIWQLEKELRPFLEDLVKPKNLRLQVNEFAGKISINGDHVNAIKYWLGERNL
ncbi:probable 39S ribosomal protein L49, mitochondrial [Tribolium madens]|uniref:probable 39S ribosomal protein L49, mitochondrial n=1 Tax=Tribolium madens TaxID=41895 RepID=UPI001CF75370|nr:probable 39S ribosomal protein L49, mitochondrial [Tribolium madens]